MIIPAKYFEKAQDFINIVCVNSKFKETTKKLRFNPILISSLKLFQKKQTQYLKIDNDKKIEGIDNYKIWYKVDYNKYLQYKENNIKYHYVISTKENMNQYGNNIPKAISILSDKSFSDNYDYPNIEGLIEIQCHLQ